MRHLIPILCIFSLSTAAHADPPPDAGAATVPAFVAPGAVLDAAPVASPIATPSPTTAPAPPAIVTVNEDAGWKVVEQYGPIAGIGLLLFYALSKFLERNKSEHWLAQGRVLAILAGLAMLGAAVLEWLANGGQAAGVPIMAVLAKALFAMPTSSSAARPAGRSQNGFAAISALLVIAVIGAVTITALQVAGCSKLGDSAKHAATGFVDCMTPSAKASTDELAPAFLDIVKNATSNTGKVDWAPVRAVASSLKSDATRCAFTSVIAVLLKPHAKDPNAPQSAELEADPADVRSGFEAIRGELYGGSRFKLASGTL